MAPAPGKTSRLISSKRHHAHHQVLGKSLLTLTTALCGPQSPGRAEEAGFAGLVPRFDLSNREALPEDGTTEWLGRACSPGQQQSRSYSPLNVCPAAGLGSAGGKDSRGHCVSDRHKPQILSLFPAKLVLPKAKSGFCFSCS